MAINAYGTLFKVEHFQMVNASLSFALTKTTPKIINFNFSLFQPRMRLGGLCAAHIWNRIELPQVVYAFVKFRGRIQCSKVFQCFPRQRGEGHRVTRGSFFLSLVESMPYFKTSGRNRLSPPGQPHCHYCLSPPPPSSLVPPLLPNSLPQPSPLPRHSLQYRQDCHDYQHTLPPPAITTVTIIIIVTIVITISNGEALSTRHVWCR